MFQIKKYLHYKNTPDGKPRVLTEGVDYHHKTDEGLWDYDITTNGFYGVANLEDCKPLLTVEIEGKIVLEDLMILIFNGGERVLLYYCSGVNWLFQEGEVLTSISSFPEIDPTIKKVSFFDDPAKYSKLLWGCSEDEGWEKVLKLLGV